MIHFLYGPDTYTLAADLAAMRADFQKRFPAGVIEEIAANNFSDQDLLARLREALESQGLFSSAKLIVLRDFVSLATKLGAEEKFLSKNMEVLPKDYELVFVEAGEVDTRRVFFKKLKKIAKVREYLFPAGKDLELWIGRLLEKHGFTMERNALARFLELVGDTPDLWQVASELEKLMLYAGEQKTITRAAVEELIPANLNQNVFALTNLFAEKRQSEALSILGNVLREGAAYELKNQAIQIVGALAGQIRSLLLVRGLDEKTNDDIARELGWKTGRVWINRRLAAKFAAERLVTMLRDLRAIDMRLKTSEEPPKLLLALFLQKAAG